MSLGDNGIDQVRLGCHALEEHIATGRVTVVLSIHVGKIWLKINSANHINLTVCMGRLT